MKPRIIALIGAVLTVYGLILCVMSNLNLGVLLVAFLGIATLCVGVFYSKITAIKTFRICRNLVIILLCVEFLLVSFIAVYGVSDNVDYNEDAIIVLGAGVPILMQAYPDEIGKMDFQHRRDAYCGKFSVTDVFEQYRVPYTVMKPHVVHPLAPQFAQNLHDFAAICRVVNGMKRFSIGCGGVAKIDNLQDKLIKLARGGFKHHTTVANGHIKAILEEAFKYYLGYDVVRIEE